VLFGLVTLASRFDDVDDTDQPD